jgi:hypothetical protein
VPLIRSRVSLAAAILATVLFGRAAPAAAEPPDKAACASAYAEGQRLQRRNALRRAREQLLVCARDPCPKVLQPDCAQWLERVEGAMPSVVIVVRGESGADRTLARVIVDGELIADRLEGRAIEIDPGEHTLRVEPEGEPAVEQRIVINEAERERPIVIRLAPPERPAPAPTSERSGPPSAAGPIAWPAYLLVAVGGVALASFGYFGAVGVGDRNALASCRGSCDPSTVDSVHRKFLIADVSLGISVVALGAAAYLFIARPGTRAAAH